MMMSNNITKLGSTNYESWKSDMCFILLERNALGIVDGTEVLSEAPAKPDTNYDIQKKDFEQRRNVAMSLIYLNIDTDYRKIVENERDPAKAWDLLEKYFHPDSRAHHMSIFTELGDSRILPDESISLFAARIQRVGNKLQKHDENFSEKYLCYQLLRHLPSSFDSVVQNVLRWKDSQFNFKSITDELVAEEMRLKVRDLDVQASNIQANAIRNAEKEKKVCSKCHNTGHLQKECRAPIPYRGQNQRRPSREYRWNSFQPRSPSPNPHRTDRSRRPNIQMKSYQTRPSQSTDSFRRQPRGYRWSSPSRRDSYRHSPNRKFNKSINSNYVIYSCETNESAGWVFDTAASHHFCKNLNYFTDFKKLRNETLSVAVDNVVFPVEGKGTVKLRFGNKIVCLKDVMYSEKLKRNLISGPRLDKEGAVFYGCRGEVKVSQGDKTLFKATLRNGLYTVYPKIVDNHENNRKFAATAKVDRKLEEWHKRLSHVSAKVLIDTSRNNGVKGLPNFNSSCILDCNDCKLNKFKRVSFKALHTIRSKAPLELLFTDVWGPYETKGKNGEKYYLSIIDDFSRKVSIYPMLDKSEVPDILKRHIIRAENFLNRRVKAVRSDNGREFVNHKTKIFFAEKGIKHELTNTYTPEQNGVAERYNSTLLSGTRTILNESGLPLCLWTEAMMYFTYTWNRLCHTGLEKTPFELYGGQKPSVRHLKQFGILTYVGIPQQLRKKLDARANKGYLVGYACKTKGYRVWLPNNNRIVETCNVRFNEAVIYRDMSNGAVLEPDNVPDRTVIYYPANVRNPPTEPIVEEPVHDTPDRSRMSSTSSESSEPDDPPVPVLRKVKWIRKPVLRSDGSRTDIYYYERGNDTRLRSLREIRDYCTKNKIVFEPHIFSFRGKNTYRGIVTGTRGNDSDESTDDEDDAAAKLSVSS